MRRPLGIGALIVTASLLVVTSEAASPPEGMLTVAVATFGNERWLPHLYPGAEDVVLKPMMENLLNRDPKTGGSALHVMLFLENLLRALLIFNGLRSRHCQRALLVYHYPGGGL